MGRRTLRIAWVAFLVAGVGQVSCKCQQSNSWIQSPAAPGLGFSTAATFGLASSGVDPDLPPVKTKGLGAVGDPGIGAASVGPGSVQLNVALAHPVLNAGQPQRTFLEIGIVGAEVQEANRAPVNVAIVLDRSGSMAGDKLFRAREAAAMVVRQLRATDSVSLVVYDHAVEVLLSATAAERAQAYLDEALQRYAPGGMTALYAGVVRGAAEVRKNLDSGKVNRVVLLSDGLANVGPSSPAELAKLGAQLGREGIGVTTIGLGLDYQSELMTRLAVSSEGNHFFANRAQDLKRGFELEFGVGLSVVAKDAVCQIRLADGVRPIRMLNHAAEITGQTVVTTLNQIYSGHRRSLLLEVEVSPQVDLERIELARLELAFYDLRSKRTERLRASVAARFTTSPAEVLAAIRRDVMVTASRMLAAEGMVRAVALRERGRIDEARRAFGDTADYLERQGRRYGAKELVEMARQNRETIDKLDDEQWREQRQQYGHRTLKTFGAIRY